MPNMIATIPFSDNLLVSEIVSKGPSAQILQELASSLDLTISQLSAVVQIPRRTLERRIATNSTLKVDEAERAIRLARLFSKAQELFGDKEAAVEWFHGELPSLGGRTPLSLCANESSAREVEQLLGRIEHGVYS